MFRKQRSGIIPYRHEPAGPPEAESLEGSESSVGASAGGNFAHDRDDEFVPDSVLLGRLANTEWCTCGRCQDPLREVDCLCCKESPQAVSLMGVAPCVTLHEDFNAVCLNKSVLTDSSTAYREFRNPKTDIFLNRYRVVVLLFCILSLAVDNSYLITYSSLRLVAYRQYTWWAHGYLGKGRRRVIPACVVSAIRQCYPDQKEAYTGFHRSEEDDSDEEHWPA